MNSNRRDLPSGLIEATWEKLAENSIGKENCPINSHAVIWNEPCNVYLSPEHRSKNFKWHCYSCPVSHKFIGWGFKGYNDPVGFCHQDSWV